MKTTDYQKAKSDLKEIADGAKKAYKGDNPAIRMIINDYTDTLCKDWNFSEHKRNLLSNYACTLHPKN